MSVHETSFEPSGELRPFVKSLWAISFSGNRRKKLIKDVPSGTDVDLIFSLGPEMKIKSTGFAQSSPFVFTGSGAFLTQYEIDPASMLVGAQLRHESAAGLIGTSIEALHRSVLDVKNIWNGETQRCIDRLSRAKTKSALLASLGEVLIERARRSPEPNAIIRFVVERIVGTQGLVEIDKLNEEAGVSKQYLCRVFKKHVGITMKMFARIHRVRRMRKNLARLRHFDLADVADAHGFSDQSHMTREFTELLGKTPRTVFAPESPDPFR